MDSTALGTLGVAPKPEGGRKTRRGVPGAVPQEFAICSELIATYAVHACMRSALALAMVSRVLWLLVPSRSVSIALRSCLSGLDVAPLCNCIAL